jgi:hypothetical protein
MVSSVFAFPTFDTRGTSRHYSDTKIVGNCRQLATVFNTVAKRGGFLAVVFHLGGNQSASWLTQRVQGRPVLLSPFNQAAF